MKGTRWAPIITVYSEGDLTEAQITTALTGASVTATLRDATGTAVSGATVTASVLSASARTVQLTMTAAVSTGLTAQETCRLDVRVTPSGGDAVALTINEAIGIRAYP